MKFEVATIKDIAKALGLSPSTISRALHDSYEISEATKARVRAYAREINYQPNPVAVSLKERKTNTIGVVVAEVANPYYSQVVNGIESVANENGYNVIIAQSFEQADRELKNLKFLTGRSIDGLIVSVAVETRDTTYLKELRRKGLPIVFFDRIVDDIEAHRVLVDNVGGARKAVEFALGQGYRRIGVINSHPALSITQDRMKGFQQGLKAFGVPFAEAMVQYCPHGGIELDEVESSIEYLLAQQPDLLFTTTDRITMHTLRVLQQKNIAIPDELGLIGFSNSDQSDIFYPSLSVIRQPAFQMGEKATRLLLQWIAAKRPLTEFVHEVLPAELILRKSTRPLTRSSEVVVL